MEYLLYFSLAMLIGLILGYGVITFLMPRLMNEAKNQLWDERERMDSSLATSVDELQRRVSTMLAEQQIIWRNTAQTVSELNTSYIRWETALANPARQGRLAEIGLEEMLQAAGLIEGVNYKVQPVQGNGGRPDITVFLPDNAEIIIDAKAPWNLYQQFIEAEEDQREQKKQAFAEGMRSHIIALQERNYPQNAERQTPEVVLMFLPNISMYLDAREADPNLTEEALLRKVSICPPEILYSSLKTVALTWQQKKTYENVIEIQALSKDLHSRIKVFNNHLFKMAASLKSTVENYNKARKSYLARLAPTLESFEDANLIPDTDTIKEQSNTSANLGYPPEVDSNMEVATEDQIKDKG